MVSVHPDPEPHAQHPLFARRDARVTVVGSLAGTHVYKTTSGDTLTVPRVRAEILLP